MARNRKEYYKRYRQEHPEKTLQYQRTRAIKLLTAEGYTVTPQADGGIAE